MPPLPPPPKGMVDAGTKAQNPKPAALLYPPFREVREQHIGLDLAKAPDTNGSDVAMKAV